MNMSESIPPNEEIPIICNPEPFAWATFNGEGGYELRLYEDNELYHDEWVQINGARYESWVIPLYRART